MAYGSLHEKQHVTPRVQVPLTKPGHGTSRMHTPRQCAPHGLIRVLQIRVKRREDNLCRAFEVARQEFSPHGRRTPENAQPNVVVVDHVDQEVFVLVCCELDITGQNKRLVPPRFGCTKDAAGFLNRDKAGGASAVLSVEASHEGVRLRHVHLELDVVAVTPCLQDLLEGRIGKRIIEVTKGWRHRMLVRARKGSFTRYPRRTKACQRRAVLCQLCRRSQTRFQLALVLTIVHRVVSTQCTHTPDNIEMGG